jgi:hypothetical protein
MSNYQPFGPFKMPTNGKQVNRHASAAFWSKVDQHDSGLSSAVGCYIFAIRAGRGAKPWYVGKTERQTFKGETWSAGKLNIYNEALNSRMRGSGILYLIAKRTRTGRFAKPRQGGIGDIRVLENLLIGSCLARNSDLLNAKQIKHLRTIVVPGYMNDLRGAPSTSAKKLAKLLGS